MQYENVNLKEEDAEVDEDGVEVHEHVLYHYIHLRSFTYDRASKLGKYKHRNQDECV